MVKLMYVLCLLVFIACSDDENGHKEDSGMSDFEKPFSNLSSDEKIGDLIMVDFNYQAFSSIYGCKMKDGTVFNFTINLYANAQ